MSSSWLTSPAPINRHANYLIYPILLLLSMSNPDRIWCHLHVSRTMHEWRTSYHRFCILYPSYRPSALHWDSCGVIAIIWLHLSGWQTSSFWKRTSYMLYVHRIDNGSFQSDPFWYHIRCTVCLICSRKYSAILMRKSFRSIAYWPACYLY